MVAWHLLRLTRPKQWVKNLFVFAPVLFAGELTQVVGVVSSLIAFAYFSVAAACVYVLNDISDVEDDRRHPIKRDKRPLASGKVSLLQARVLLVVLYLALATGFLWNWQAMLPIVGYLALNVAYSLSLRHIPVVDIFTIALGFVARVVAGALAIAAPLSAWMFITTLCLALYLAAIKRRQELARVGSGSRKVLNDYSVSLVENFAVISATGALVFYSIFALVAREQLVYTIPFVLFGLFRYWYISDRLESAESPTEAMLRDIPLVVTVAIWTAICAFVLVAGN
jgi:decaprenyl-phosphate phosphoribosyltransferase